MEKKGGRFQLRFLAGLIIVCMGIILAGGFQYVNFLRENLKEQNLQNVMTVTRQQQQAVDIFISGDMERLHSFAHYFTAIDSTPEDVQRQLTLFNDVNAIYSVVCVDESWLCSNASSVIRELDEETTGIYRNLNGAGIRDSYVGFFSGKPRFGYYETFTFANGHKGVIQKSYDRTKVMETFSLSFYNDQGMSHVVNRNGDILMRPASVTENLYANIFDAIAGYGGQEDRVSRFREALQNNEEGTIFFSRGSENLVYTYVPMESVDGWSLVSVVSSDTIRAQTDEILHSSRVVMIFLTLMLLSCAVFIFLIWRTWKEISSRDREIEYKTQLFNIFATHLSRNSDDMFMLVDQETGNIEYISPNVERVLGVTRDGVEDYYLNSDRAAGDGTAETYLEKIAAMSPGETICRSAERINSRTGERRYFRENAYAVELQGRSKRVYYISDRTREHRDRTSLADALQMAKAASEAKSAFLSSISHDIRTPMNAIIGFLTLLRNEADNRDAVLEYVRRIDAASQHLLGLINDVLDLNKIESGSATLNLSEMELAEVIDEINTIIRPQTREKEQTFDIFVASLEHEHLIADKLRINQILINLLSNAVKYTPRGGNIQLRVEERKQVVSNYSRIRFTVSDNGMGMSEAYQKIIFDPFTREETIAVHETQGTGLGMSITKSLVDLMGGTIKVESRQGEGTAFTVELELRIQEQKDDLNFWTAHNVARMIVADDDESVCQGIVRVMARTGVTVDYATDGETAVQMMRHSREKGTPYDLILLDWKMPNLDGLETARLIRRNYCDRVPILLLTAYDWSDIEKEAMEIGVNHFLPKPFFMSNFREAIRRVMGSAGRADGEAENIVQDRHILVVDDIEVNRIILVKILTTLGARCDIASNGQEALEAFEKTQPGDLDLILMDVQMPVMDGYDATRAIRSSGHPSAGTVPIIAMTANAFVDDVREAINAGMDAHVAKPVQMDKLKETIRETLDRRREKETGNERSLEV